MAAVQETTAFVLTSADVEAADEDLGAGDLILIARSAAALAWLGRQTCYERTGASRAEKVVYAVDALDKVGFATDELKEMGRYRVEERSQISGRGRRNWLLIEIKRSAADPESRKWADMICFGSVPKVGCPSDSGYSRTTTGRGKSDHSDI